MGEEHLDNAKPGLGVAGPGPIRALAILGTRPEAVKLAPLVLELVRRPTFDVQVCLTAQHRELLDEPLELFGIKADHDLDLMRQIQDPMDVVARALPGLSEVMAEVQPEVVLVQGDTTTAFCGAFAAEHHRCAVGHVEAGLRTGHRYEPFPEEINRRLIGQLATFHFAPTAAARDALLAEGAEERRVFVTGNTVVDAVQQVAAMEAPADLPTPAPGRRLVLVTCHRREHHGDVQRGIFRALREVVEKVEDVECFLPVHPHPKVRGAAEEVLQGVDRVRLLDPLSYRKFVHLLARAELVVTDSGGVQEEAPSVDTPAVVLRRATERREGLEAGTALLAGTDPDVIAGAVLGLLENPARLAAMKTAQNPYGDGRASERIANALQVELRDSEQLAQFGPA